MKKLFVMAILILSNTFAFADVRYVMHTDPMTDKEWPQVIITNPESEKYVTIFCDNVVLNKGGIFGWTGTTVSIGDYSSNVYETITYRFDKKQLHNKIEFLITQMSKQLYMRDIDYNEMVNEFKASNNFAIQTYGYQYNGIGAEYVKFSLKGSTKALNKLAKACPQPTKIGKKKPTVVTVGHDWAEKREAEMKKLQEEFNQRIK